ncbi:MAG: aldehyde dehydrogenase family protein [Myxococcota bacterium]
MALVERIEGRDADGRHFRLRSPATLEPVGEFAACTAEEVHAAVDTARKAQRDWGALSHEERGRYLKRAITVLLEKQDEFAAVIASETGKPEAEVVGPELLMSCDVLSFYAKRAGRILAERSVPLHLLKTKKLKISYRPLGVIGIITPWNVPFLLSLNPTVQALIAGNAVILKPSEVTPHSGQLVEALWREAGLPEGVFQCLLGDGETGAALVSSSVDKVSFTGSVGTGRKVAEACARNLTPCTLELGGKDPMVVCADADLERAASGAVFGAFANAGQICVSTERVYVVDEVADEFERKVVEKTAELRQGAGGGIDIGPMIQAEQLEKVESQVADAVARGARVLAGGRRNPDHAGLFFEPTVLVDVTHDMAIMRDETFGPVLPIMRVCDEEEALQRANDTRYGLSANVWTRDKRKGATLGKRIEAGSVVVNDCMLTYGTAEAPFGGRRESGIGQVNGEIGLRGYCHAQSILVDRFGGKTEALWFPYTARKVRLLRRMMRFLWGTPLGRFLS